MGCQIRHLSFSPCSTPAELRKLWKETVEEDTYNKGHDTYNGSIRHVDDLDVHPVRFKTAKEASVAREGYNVEKREARAFAYGDPAKAFPMTAADKKMVTTLTALEKELEGFEFDVLTRFVKGKSASRKCGHCDSVISKKSRMPFALRPPVKTSSVLDYRDAIRELTACPCCGHELLQTETDKKRKTSLKTRVGDLAAKVTKAKAAHYAKHEPCGYLVIAGCPS